MRADTWEIRWEREEIKHFKAEATFKLTAFNSPKFIDEKHEGPKKESDLLKSYSKLVEEPELEYQSFDL